MSSLHFCLQNMRSTAPLLHLVRLNKNWFITLCGAKTRPEISREILNHFDHFPGYLWAIFPRPYD